MSHTCGRSGIIFRAGLHVDSPQMYDCAHVCLPLCRKGAGRLMASTVGGADVGRSQEPRSCVSDANDGARNMPLDAVSLNLRLQDRHHKLVRPYGHMAKPGRARAHWSGQVRTERMSDVRIAAMCVERHERVRVDPSAADWRESAARRRVSTVKSNQRRLNLTKIELNPTN